jgi:hypothetical protein
MTITRNALRNVTVGALVTVWGVTRHRGKRDGDDLVVRGATVSVIDDIAELPGFGDAMESVGWVVADDEGLRFPHFFEEYNVEPNDDHKEKNAERQRRHREKNNALRNVTVTSQSNDRIEKRREEITGTGPTRRFAAQESTASIGNREALSKLRIEPLPRGTITNGQALASLPDDITNRPALAEWWRRHLSSDKPLTGDTALDLLQVLCAATETTRKGRKIENKAAWLAARLADGEWLNCSTAAAECYRWLREQIELGRIKIMEGVTA